MNINTLIQFILMLAIGVLAYFVINTVQQPPQRHVAKVAELELFEASLTSGPIRPVIATPAVLSSLDSANLFEPILKKLTPRPTTPRRTPTPRPPIPVDKITKLDGWKVKGILSKSGQVMLQHERGKKTDFFKVGDVISVNYAGKNLDIKLVEIDVAKMSATFEYEGTRQVMSMFGA